MKRMHVVGRKNHGKTQLVVELVEEFMGRGLRVGTIKHTHHSHELDTPGKDSHRHREAGAVMVGVVSRNMSAVFIPSAQPPESDECYGGLEAAFADCDLVLVEGHSKTRAPKIEVWRAELGTKPLAESDQSILAVVTDGPLTFEAARWLRSDVRELADWILATVCDRA